MKFNTLKKDYRKKKILISIIVTVVIGITLIISTSLAKYRTTQSIPLVNGTISYSPSDIIINAYFDGVLVDEFPQKDSSKFLSISCDKEATATFNEDDWSIDVSLINKGTICNIYFASKYGASAEYILANKNFETRTDFSTIVTADTTGTIYTAEDNDGTSYYYAGAPTDNWFYFGGYYWRIVRINGDGTVRLIYNGTSTTTTGEGTQIGTSAFNASHNSNEYSGYMYTLGSLRGIGTSSTIKGVVDSWYDSNLASYASYIDTNAGFCGDRTPSTDSSSSNGSGGIGANVTYYIDNIRYYNNGQPTLKCANSSDLYTKSGANKGNKALTNPIGLINMNEVWLAGGHQDTNSSYYLYSKQAYWTISPSGSYSGNTVGTFHLYPGGSLTDDYDVDTVIGVRPVINLRSDLELTGSGTSSDPYKIKSNASETILANKTVSSRTDFSTVVTEDTTGTIYTAEDDDGTSYYFAGAPTDNWVKFAGFYWRIIRINGDGTIRLIYDGTSARENGTSSSSSIISTSGFSVDYTQNMYVGYMYTNGSVHGLGTSSTIKGVLEDWYNSDLKNYKSFIDTNAGFCNDRQPSTTESSLNGLGGTGKTQTYYAGYIRLITNKTPTFKCANASDLFTIASSNKGNKVLSYPIGLITADEVAYAGSVYDVSNRDYYLYIGDEFWSMTPDSWDESPGYANVYLITTSAFDGSRTSRSFGVRPVINLRSDIELLGSGTTTDPYVVKGAE